MCVTPTGGVEACIWGRRSREVWLLQAEQDHVGPTGGVEERSSCRRNSGV